MFATDFSRIIRVDPPHLRESVVPAVFSLAETMIKAQMYGGYRLDYPTGEPDDMGWSDAKPGEIIILRNYTLKETLN